MNELINQSVTEVFVEQPLALPGSSKHGQKLTIKLVTACMCVLSQITSQVLLGIYDISYFESSEIKSSIGFLFLFPKTLK